VEHGCDHPESGSTQADVASEVYANRMGWPGVVAVAAPPLLLAGLASTRTPAPWSNHAAPRPAGNRVISRTVTPLPHQSTASRSDKPSSSVIVRSASQPAAQHPEPEHRVHPARLAPRPPELRACVRDRPVLYAAPPAHLTLSAAPASPSADSSHLPYRPVLIDTGLSLSPKPCRRLERSSPTISTCFTYPQPISRSDVPHT
jgi:hypothetical protein